MHRSNILLCLPLVISLGCGDPKSSDEDTGSETAGDGDGDGDTGTGCGIEFEEAAPGTSGMFTLRNDRDVTIYVPRAIVDCTWEAWQVFDGDTPVYWNDAFVPTCAQMITNACVWGCKDDSTTVIKLDPGATWTEAWGYYVWAPVELTATCVEGTMCDEGDVCWAGRAMLEGELSARIRVLDTCSFTDDCSCEGDACLIDIGSLEIEGINAEIIDIGFDASQSDILLAIE